MQYLYKDGDFWTFMNPENYEQLQAGEAAVGDAAKWLKDGIVCIITLWNGVPLRGDPAAAHRTQGHRNRSGPAAATPRPAARRSPSSRPAPSVRVPLFINEGEMLRIDTRTGEYVSRAKS